MELVSPLLVSELTAHAARQPGLLRTGALGPGMLLGHLPVDTAQAWPQRTPLATFPNAAGIVDVGSTQGTWLNDVRLVPQCKAALLDGDRVRLGQVELRFRAGERLVPLLEQAVRPAAP